MTKKGILCSSDHLGKSGGCPTCIEFSFEEPTGHAQCCESCEFVVSGYFTHRGGAGEYLRRIGFTETEEGGLDRFLVPENRSVDGVTWDHDAAKCMLTEAEIPESEMERTIFEACATVYDKEMRLLVSSGQCEWEEPPVDDSLIQEYDDPFADDPGTDTGGWYG